MTQTTMTLDLELPATTIRKLRALAMLSGMTVDDIKVRIANGIDSILTDECAAHLGISASPVAATPARAIDEDQPMEDAATGHGLSNDDDSQDNPSLEEQVAPVKKSFAAAEKEASANLVESSEADLDDPPFIINREIKDVGGDAEAFVDAAFEVSKKQKTSPNAAPPPTSGVYHEGEQAVFAKKGGFIKPRVNISDSAGDEGNTTRWFQQ